MRSTVPSRMSRTIGSSTSERAFQASQSLFTLRQTRVIVSLPTAPPNTAPSARRTRRVLVRAHPVCKRRRVLSHGTDAGYFAFKGDAPQALSVIPDHRHIGWLHYVLFLSRGRAALG